MSINTINLQPQEINQILEKLFRTDYEFLMREIPENITDEELFAFRRLVPDFLDDYE